MKVSQAAGATEDSTTVEDESNNPAKAEAEVKVTISDSEKLNGKIDFTKETIEAVAQAREQP